MVNVACPTSKVHMVDKDDHTSRDSFVSRTGHRMHACSSIDKYDVQLCGQGRIWYGPSCDSGRVLHRSGPKGMQSRARSAQARIWRWIEYGPDGPPQESIGWAATQGPCGASPGHTSAGATWLHSNVTVLSKWSGALQVLEW